MAWISLEGMRFHAFHGVYAAEQILGADYVVDIKVKTGIGLAAERDRLEYTINYETVYQICRMEMKEPHQLIETVLHGIINRMKHQFLHMEALVVRLRKIHPPLGGRVDSAWVEEVEDFVDECPRCHRPFINYDDDCWSRYPNIHPATRETLQREYNRRCLCPDCVRFYAG